MSVTSLTSANLLKPSNSFWQHQVFPSSPPVQVLLGLNVAWLRAWVLKACSFQIRLWRTKWAARCPTPTWRGPTGWWSSDPSSASPPSWPQFLASSCRWRCPSPASCSTRPRFGPTSVSSSGSRYWTLWIARLCSPRLEPMINYKYLLWAVHICCQL